jgi:hypothetical protein
MNKVNSMVIFLKAKRKDTEKERELMINCFMKENTKMTGLMERENIFGLRIQIIMMVSGNLEYLKDLVSKFQMAPSIKVIGKTVSQMDMEFSLFKTKVAMTEIGKMDNLMVKVLKLMQMAQNTKVIGF